MIEKLNEKYLNQTKTLQKHCFGDHLSNDLDRVITDKNYHYFIYLQNDSVIGFIGLLFVDTHAEIMEIGVHENNRNSKIGKALLEHAQNYIKLLGGEGFLLEVRQDNEYAIRLYNSFGFRALSIRKNYYDGKIDAIVMKKDF